MTGLARTVFFVIVSGLLLRFAVSLEPVWWLAWLAPIPLLLLAFSLPRWTSAAAVFVAASIAFSAHFHFFSLLMPLPVVFGALAGQALVWTLVIAATRSVVLAYRSGWTVLAYPVFWVAADTLLTVFNSDGNWGTVAYSQSDVLPLVQITALAGVPGLLFVLGLFPSTIAVLVWHRHDLKRPMWTAALAAVALVAAVGYGTLRLRTPVEGTPTRVGMASIDDFVGPKTSPEKIAQVRGAYDALVEQLAGKGATLIVLPEKIAMLSPQSVDLWQAHFSALAAQQRVWIEVGIGVDESPQPRNYAWLFNPAGQRAERYEKHILAPPERFANYATSNEYNLHEIGGARYGLAICKDMHFASLGLDNGRLGADVMLVPAWDFGYLDGWLEARTTMIRGVENGYAVIRAAREGLLTASDAYGRVLAEKSSSAMPGSSLIADMRIGKRLPTVYSRIGGLPGWLGLGAALVMILCAAVAGRMRSRVSTKVPAH